MGSGDVVERKVVDAEHLRLLSIFHFVSAGLAMLGVAFASFYLMMFQFFFSKPEIWAKSQQAPPPQFVMRFFAWFILSFLAWFLVAAVGNFLSGFFLRSHHHRTFSMGVAALNCLHIPIGTILGIFTLVVLSRDSVRELYEP